MTEPTEGQGAAPELPEPITHSRSSGPRMDLSNDKPNELLTLWVSGDDLRQLCTLPGAERCDGCKFSRTNSFGEVRCHVNAPRTRQGATFFPRVPADGYCGKFRALVRPHLREVAA